MLSKSELRGVVRDNVLEITRHLNEALDGSNIEHLEPVLRRVGRGNALPHWYEQLLKDKTLPNLDGKTIGSIVEMLLVAVLESFEFSKTKFPKQLINPARGVDLPGLDLGVKSPSENYCTSEPFFSAYERILGQEYDALILLTDYQSAKASPPLKLQIVSSRYLTRTEIADRNLCATARAHREFLLTLNESWAKKFFRFLAFVNQSDWRAKHLIKILKVLDDDESVRRLVKKAEIDFSKKNRKADKEGKELIEESELRCLQDICSISPLHLGVVDACDNWVVEVLGEAGRFPNNNEWSRLQSDPLDGKIGMSFALQWRYNFKSLFES